MAASKPCKGLLRWFCLAFVMLAVVGAAYFASTWNLANENVGGTGTSTSSSFVSFRLRPRNRSEPTFSDRGSDSPVDSVEGTVFEGLTIKESTGKFKLELWLREQKLKFARSDSRIHQLPTDATVPAKQISEVQGEVVKRQNVTAEADSSSFWEQLAEAGFLPDKSPKANLSKTEHRKDDLLTNSVPVEKLPSVSVQGTDCKKLIRSVAKEVQNALLYQSSHPYHKVPDEEYVKETRNCDRFKSNRRYILEPLSQMENDFPLGYSIVMFKDVEQFERLLRAIYRPQNHYCIHVDAKASVAVRAGVRGIADCFNNVFLASKTVRVEWGTFTVVEADLICMAELWHYTKWKYFINLTGQEFPLKTNSELVRILQAFNHSNNMEGTVKR